MLNLFSEDALIEQPALALLGQVGWETANRFEETFGTEGRWAVRQKAKLYCSRACAWRWKSSTPICPHMH